MQDSPPDLIDWHRALTLAERAALGSPNGSPGNAAADELASHRLAEWRGLTPFRSGPWWDRRLEDLGLTGESFARLLALPPHQLGAELPGWMAELADRTSPDQASEATPVPAEVAGAAGFLELVRPYLDRARLRLREDLATLVREADRPLPFTVESGLRLASETLPYRILPILSRTLVLELNVARMQGLLPGETPRERFAAFVERLRDPEIAAAILREYPVLARQALLDLELFRESTLELLSHLAEDWPAIVERFFDGRDPGPLTALDGGAGDRHRRGRAVRILTFSEGSRLVYKPRSLLVEAHFQELLAWVNAEGDHLGFRTLAVLDRGDHGWMEFATADPCSSREEVARFHERLGGLLAILYGLAATDCHYENLIAAGEHPVVVDLESLFHPQIQRGSRTRPQAELRSQFALHSVLRVGLLPFQIGGGEDIAGIDISGVSAVGGQQTPRKVIQWQGTGTDEMRVVRDHALMEDGRNRPVLDGEPAQVGEYREEMTRGFETVYRLLAQRRGKLDLLLARFADDPVRVVLRPTQIYGLLLTESFHPDFLRDALDRDRLFDRLWLEAENQPNLARVIAAEHRDLSEGDIPSFSTFPSSRDLWTSRGERIRDFLEESSYDLVRHRLRLLGEEDLRRQLWLLRLSLGTQVLNREDVEWTSYAPDPQAPRLPPGELRESLLRHARALGGWFAEMAVREGDYASWIGLEYRNKRWSLEPTPEDLYAGLPGIALFLGFLGEIAGDPAATALARAAIATLRLQLEARPEGDPGPASIGAFQGWGGIVWTLAQLGHLWRDRELLAAGERMVERFPALLAADEEIDLIAGTAGAILGLLALHQAGGSAARPGGGGPGRRTAARARGALGIGIGLAHPAGGRAPADRHLARRGGDRARAHPTRGGHRRPALPRRRPRGVRRRTGTVLGGSRPAAARHARREAAAGEHGRDGLVLRRSRRRPHPPPRLPPRPERGRAHGAEAGDRASRRAHPGARPGAEPLPLPRRPRQSRLPLPGPRAISRRQTRRRPPALPGAGPRQPRPRRLALRHPRQHRIPRPDERLRRHRPGPAAHGRAGAGAFGAGARGARDLKVYSRSLPSTHVVMHRWS